LSCILDGAVIVNEVDDAALSILEDIKLGGSAPTLATTGFTVIELWKVGSTIYGALVGNVA